MNNLQFYLNKVSVKPAAAQCELLEFGVEADLVHLLADIHPALKISTLINNLKTASARRCGARFREHLVGFYKKAGLPAPGLLRLQRWRRHACRGEAVRAGPRDDGQGGAQGDDSWGSRRSRESRPPDPPPDESAHASGHLSEAPTRLGKGMRGHILFIKNSLSFD